MAGVKADFRAKSNIEYEKWMICLKELCLEVEERQMQFVKNYHITN